MKKNLIFLLFCLFSFSAIHAENKWESEPDGTEWYLSVDGTLTVSKEGDMPNYDEGETPWDLQRDDIKKIVIKEGVTRIGDYAFAGCQNLTSITFKGSNPPKFGANVFNAANENVSVYVPANSIDEYKTKLGGLSSKVKGAIILADDEAYTRESDTEGVAAFYTRNFTNGNWQALYLPFSLKYEAWKDDFEMAYINGIIQWDNDYDGVIDETELEIIKMKSGSTQPNAPYLIRAKTKGEKTFSVMNTTVYAADENSVDCSTTTAKFTFTGTYSTIPYETLISNEYYAMGGGELVMSNGSDLRPYRWYMKVENRNYSPLFSNCAKAITIRVLDEDETTAISEVQMTNDQLPIYPSTVYDLNGRKVSENNLKPGVYVKNGKKVMVK
ncbi:MAG: leucine-rich repeat domain-containing protein [Prevotella sp.]|nr:leucine-rich repeat domain-containing protein [Prevotella sp.]